jgi:putative transcriptional regulator
MSIMPLSSTILIATSKWNNTIFEKSLIFVCEHHEQGSVGLICNRPTSFNLDYICQQLNVDCQFSEHQEMPLLFGGPIQPERGFVLHHPHGHWRSSLVIDENYVTLTTSNDIIKALASNEGPNKVMIALGYSGWEPHKLEEEIRDDLWLVCPFSQELLYEVPFAKRWHHAGMLLGVNMDQMVSGRTGHA